MIALPRDRRTGRPLLGGIIVYLVIVLALAIVVPLTDVLPSGFVSAERLLGLVIGGLILVIGGVLDDKFDLKPSQQFIFPVIAAAVAVGSGISMEYLKNPFGGIVTFAPAIGAVITFVWLLGMTYTTKVLDGLDGLVAGIGAIAAVIMLLVALRPELAQPDAAVLATILAGAFLLFLLLNFPPARIQLGEGGSTFVGFSIGVLAVIAGSKVATTLLVVAVPVLDLAWTIIRRKFVERRSVAIGDRGHLHFRLQHAGLSARRTLLIFYAVAAAAGLIGLFTETVTKLIALAVVFILGIIILWNAQKNVRSA